mgnify:FL=1
MLLNVEQSAPGTLAPGAQPRRRQLAALFGFLAASWAVSLVGSLPIRMNAAWYAAADTAPWTPPVWMFGSAWLVLYAAMAVAAWLVWRQRIFPRREALKVYVGLLLLNLAWPLMFFGLYPVMGTAALWLALLIIAAHSAFAVFAVLRFGPISTPASLNLYAALHN